MVLKLLFILLTVGYVLCGNDYRCGKCQCLNLDPYIVADCRGKGLKTLPLFDMLVTFSLKKLYLNDNRITSLDQDIIKSWSMLYYIDLTGNNISCHDLNKFPEKVKIKSDCHHAYTGKLAYSSHFL